jgi:hypothetical protein
MSRFWLVELDEDLAAHQTTRTGVWCGIKGVNGVASVTDLDAVSRGTLDAMLVPPDKTWEAVRRKLGVKGSTGGVD